MSQNEPQHEAILPHASGFGESLDAPNASIRAISIADVIAEASRRLVEENTRAGAPGTAAEHADVFEGDHEDPGSPTNTIEYWIWNGERLLPALPEQVLAFQAYEEAQRQEQLQRKLHTPPPPRIVRWMALFGRWWGRLVGESR